ncbi:meiosis-specific with OB domain-containing protein isoform X2 [Prorops nasuta]|uniref:meiosis-specific with OB domain-containing protein isoform X2 n=1 Tax=Prorops nasuta TaxID=863751 RepID=UPI0034CEBB25
MAGVNRQKIRSLNIGVQNSLIIGVIINSSNFKTFDGSQMKFNKTERGVWTFTLRDSEEDFINVTVWGSAQYVKKLYSTFHIGSIVEAVNGKVTSRGLNDKNEFFVPSATSQYNLSINENSALIQFHDAPDKEEYEKLLALPTRSIELSKELVEILNNIEDMRDQFVDVFVIVTFVSDGRDIITKDGRSLKCRSFEALDSSTEDTVALMLWEKEWVERAEFWEPKKTVLHLVDAKIAYDKYKNKIALSIARKTLITENPTVQRTAYLRKMLSNREKEILSTDPFAVPNPHTITNVMTIQEITSKLNTWSNSVDNRIQFAVILRAKITEMNTDTETANTFLIKCALCKKILNDKKDSCMNLECPCGNGSRIPLNTVILNIKLNLKDSTGYLIGCRLTGPAAERTLGCSATKFQSERA